MIMVRGYSTFNFDVSSFSDNGNRYGYIITEKENPIIVT